MTCRTDALFITTKSTDSICTRDHVFVCVCVLVHVCAWNIYSICACAIVCCWCHLTIRLTSMHCIAPTIANPLLPILVPSYKRPAKWLQAEEGFMRPANWWVNNQKKPYVLNTPGENGKWGVLGNFRLTISCSAAIFLTISRDYHMVDWSEDWRDDRNGVGAGWLLCQERQEEEKD